MGLIESGLESMSRDGVSLVTVEESDLLKISAFMHHQNKRCGGFFAYPDAEDALEAFAPPAMENEFFVDYSLDQEERVSNWIQEVSDIEITQTIQKLSSFHNRYYKSDTGLASQDYLMNKWKGIAQGRNDVTVEKFKHRNWPQPSVILTIQGSERPDEIVVMGGHADSIAGWWGQARNRAPGADDNASGIATLTEALRIMMVKGYSPKRTIKFMGYAAEEVGLLGSQDIARSFKAEGKQVVGVLQLDMTNFNGSSKDIAIISDFTSEEQNKFLVSLIDKYINLPWGYSRCGYACSDHASWHKAGYRASIPFEALKGDMNSAIHTAGDTLERSGNHSRHAAKFAKLAVAYALELAK